MYRHLPANSLWLKYNGRLGAEDQLMPRRHLNATSIYPLGSGPTSQSFIGGLVPFGLWLGKSSYFENNYSVQAAINVVLFPPVQPKNRQHILSGLGSSLYKFYSRRLLPRCLLITTPRKVRSVMRSFGLQYVSQRANTREQ
jgi:hypothetical protein